LLYEPERRTANSLASIFKLQYWRLKGDNDRKLLSRCKFACLIAANSLAITSASCRARFDRPTSRDRAKSSFHPLIAYSVANRRRWCTEDPFDLVISRLSPAGTKMPRKSDELSAAKQSPTSISRNGATLPHLS
jgi:hypothetical protein